MISKCLFLLEYINRNASFFLFCSVNIKLVHICFHTIKQSSSPLLKDLSASIQRSSFPFRFDQGLGERQRPRHLLLCSLFLEVQDSLPPVWDDLGSKPAQLDRLFHQAAGERWDAALGEVYGAKLELHCSFTMLFGNRKQT